MNNRKMDTQKSQTLATNIEIPKLARYLREKGIQARNMPGLILKKAADLYIAILCMLKSGIAYLSISTDYPQCQRFEVSYGEMFLSYFFQVFVPKKANIGVFKSGINLLNFPLEQKME